METVDNERTGCFLDDLRKLNDLPHFLTQEARNKIFLDLIDTWKSKDPIVERLVNNPVIAVSEMVSQIVNANTLFTTSFDNHFATEEPKTKARLSSLIPEWEFWARDGWIFPHSNRDLLEKPRIIHSYFWSAWGIMNFIMLSLLAIFGGNYLVIGFGWIFVMGVMVYILNAFLFLILFGNMKSHRKAQAYRLANNADFIDGKIKLYRELRQNQAAA